MTPNQLPIVSIQKEVFQEYKDQVSLMLFTRGCNFDCIYCFNKKRINNEPIGDAVSLLKTHITPLHTAVVISGGEPTIHSQALEETLAFIKEELKLKTKLFTNGSNILVIQDLLNKNLLDSISLDLKKIKNVVSYIQAPGYSFDLTYIANIKFIISLCKTKQIPLDLRTVLHPSVDYSLIDKFLEVNNAKDQPLISIYTEKFLPIEG